MLNTCLIQDTDAGGWEHFRDASDIVLVTPTPQSVEQRVERDGLWAAAWRTSVWCKVRGYSSWNAMAADLDRDGRRITPPVECGLLPGVFRAHLLKRGEIVEERIRLDELRHAARIWVVNSVRKWREAELND